MDISVDGEKRPFDNPPETIGGLIDEVKTRAARSTRVVLSIRVDGADLDVAAQKRIAQSPICDFSSLAVETADAKSLCVATLEEAGRHIQPVIDEAERIGELIDQGKDGDALGRMAPCLEVLGTIVAAVEKVSILLELDLNEVAFEGASLADIITRLSDFLRSLKSSIDARDLVAARDSMKHELPEIASALEQQLSALSSAVAAS
jgi:hypothetical protein